MTVTNAWGDPPLYVALKRHKDKAAQILIERGAPIDTTNRWGASPITYAALLKEPTILNILLQRVRGTNAKALASHALLSVAGLGTGYDLQENAQLLLDHGADPNVAEIGITAVCFAAGDAKNRVLDLLIIHGADPNKCNALERVIYMANNKESRALDKEDGIVRNYQETVAILIRAGVNVAEYDSDGLTALHHAALGTQTNIVAAILNESEGARTLLSKPDPDRLPVIMCPIITTNAEMLKCLLDNGADANLAVPGYVAPIFAAVRKKQTDLVKTLIPYISNIDQLGEAGETALMVAAYNGSSETVDALIAAGANIETEDPNGRTALRLACEGKTPTAAEVLIAKGANVNTRNKLGETPLLFAAAYGKDDLFRMLISAGADINTKDNDQNTPLIYAVVSSNIDVVEMALSAGADVNALNKDGEGALMHAALTKNAPIMKLLIQHGANVNQSSNEGHTPLSTSTVMKSVECVDILLGAGAKPQLSTVAGRPLNEVVKKLNNPDMLRVFEKYLNPKVSREEFIRRLRDQYPEYRDLDDDVLFHAITTKYPVYLESIKE